MSGPKKERAHWARVFDGKTGENVAYAVASKGYVLFNASRDEDGNCVLSKQHALEFAAALLACALKMKQESFPQELPDAPEAP